MLRKLILLSLLVIAAGLAGSIWIWTDYQRFRQAPILTGEGTVVLWVAPGSSYSRMVRELSGLGLTEPDWRWRLLGRLEQPALQAGEYELEPGTTPLELLEKLRAGRVRLHRFTIVEGWQFQDLRDALASDERLRSETAEWSSAQIMEALDCPGCDAEGRFLPETYFFVRKTPDLGLLRRSFESMNRVMEEAWANRDPDLPLSDPLELLVLASIVEKETGLAVERGKVAGVFARRLEQGMRLQTDPTVIYGLDESFGGRLTRADLRTDHPWNTYTRHGLPPTPIALPGRDSILASARPEEGTELYFVARGDGSHQFSDTLAEHNAAVNRYIRGRSQ